MLDDAAFHQVLSNSALHLGSLKMDGSRETVESIKYHTEAVESVKMRITDPILGITDGIIVAIIAFACHDVYIVIPGPKPSDWLNETSQHMVENFDRWGVHINGLLKILEIRGGIEVFDKHKLMRLVLMWYVFISSLNGSSRVLPLFPQPPNRN
jgi:hypothetical protein